MLTQVPAPPLLHPAARAAHTYKGRVPRVDGEGSVSLFVGRVHTLHFPANRSDIFNGLLRKKLIVRPR